ncbi:MAG: efflux RND transporter periplasmic adaptor subunit [Phycisphaeraceae bacterium]
MMQNRLSMLTTIILLLGSGAATALGQFDATTKAPHDVELAFSISGRIASIKVEPGMTVEAGQTLIELDDQGHQAQLELDRLQAESDVQVRVAQQRLELAKLDEQRSKQLIQSAERTQAARKLAELELEQARQQHKQAEQRFRLAKARHDQYALRAPTDGTIERVFASQGQLVNAGQPIVRVLQNQTLWVDAAVPTEQTYDLSVGSPAWVLPQQPYYDQPIEGRIIHLAQVIDAETDTRRVRVQIPNEIGLLVGAYVTVTFQKPAPQARDANARSGTPTEP